MVVDVADVRGEEQPLDKRIVKIQLCCGGWRNEEVDGVNIEVVVL